MSPEARSRAAVIVKTLTFTGTYVFGVILFHQLYFASRATSRALSAAISIAVVQCATILAMLAFSFVAKLIRQLRTSRAARAEPRIRELLALHAAGTDIRERIPLMNRSGRAALEECLVEFLHMVRGSGRDALSELADDLGFVERWRSQFRSRNVTRRKSAIARLALLSRRYAQKTLQDALADGDESVRLHAARAILKYCEAGDAEKVFDVATHGTFVTRMILAEDLRPHVLELAVEAIPSALESGDQASTLAALEMVRAWGKFLPVRGVYPLLRHAEPSIRAAALHVIPQVAQSSELHFEILRALEDPSEEVRPAAAHAAAAMDIRDAVPALARQLHNAGTKTAWVAGRALAELGAEGRRILERETITGSPAVAAVALEALERIQISRTRTVTR